MIPDLLLVRSNSKQAKFVLDAELSRLGISPRVAFGVDGYKVKQALAFSELDAVFGSTWEKYLAEEIARKLHLIFFSRPTGPSVRDLLVWG